MIVFLCEYNNERCQVHAEEFREYLRHFHFQTSGNCRHQTFLFSTIRFFQTSDTLFSNLIYFQRSGVFFQTSDISKHLTFLFSNIRYFQTTDTLFSNLKYVKTSDTCIFKPQIFSEIWHFHFQHQILQLLCRFLGSSIGWRQILLTAQTLLRNQILNQNGILWFVRKK